MGLFFTELHHPLPLALMALLGGYLSGSVPYGLILTRLAGMGDIRKEGSGNIGATNVLRLGGKKLGAVTLLLDALKGAVPVLVAKSLHMDYAVMAGLGAFFGHLFPVWLKFKGGKGVATGLGIAFGFSWLLGLMLCGIWMLVAAISQYSSLSALVAFGLSPLVAMRLTGSLQVTAVFFVLAVIIWIRHHANIKRLAAGTEGKIDFKKKDKTA
ncbi:MAG: glycerol-3-phosphate 1-O-acyltransferase PlsY [Alphaproteobacteria bacterium]|nr:glycerol-3-phosphate 1-O-acyltransferase PlsY [Alphaproteobacteria bacterium]